MDELIFTLMSKEKPCVDDVMAVLRACIAAEDSAYCTVDDMKNDAMRGKKIGFDTETAFRVQFHMSMYEKDDNGLPMFIFDLFISDNDVRTTISPECHVSLSSELSKIKVVSLFRPVSMRADYNRL